MVLKRGNCNERKKGETSKQIETKQTKADYLAELVAYFRAREVV